MLSGFIAMVLRKVTLFDKEGTAVEPTDEEGQAKPAVMGVRWVNPDTYETILVRGGKRTGPRRGLMHGDMGADVIRVEPPGGDRSRRIGPFFDDRIHPDRSLFFWFYNLNKRSLTLDLKRARGAELLKSLARSSDVLIESFAPGEI